jgi:hypothetical protein
VYVLLVHNCGECRIEIKSSNLSNFEGRSSKAGF